MIDVTFWAVACAAVLVIAFSKSGLLAGLGPIGVPILALVMSPRDAAGVLLPILLVMDVFALYAYRKDFDLKNLKVLLPGAVIGVGIGWAASSVISDDMVLLAVGLITTIFVLDTIFPIRKRLVVKPPSKIWGTFWGGVSGVTSFVSHAGVPPFQVYVLPQKLAPAVYAGTTAWFFGFANFIKLPPYFFLGQLSTGNLNISLALAPVAILGMLLGIYLVRRISVKLFYRLAYIVIFCLGIALIYRGATGVFFGG